MPISREYARSLFVDLTQSATVPLDPDELLHMPGLRQHGQVFFGDIALRCYKHKARWMYDERDIRRVGQALADVLLDTRDVVDVQLPPYRDISDRDPEEWSRPDWRRRLVSWMFDQARQKAQEGRPYEEWDDSWRQIQANGLPGNLTWEEFVAASSRHRHSQNIAGTRPLRLLTWSGEGWLLPRAYAELLDRWEQREGELISRARLCSCGAVGPYWGGWRRNTRTGYVTMCPPCSGMACRSYTGQMRDVLYESSRRRGARADEYLCRLCKESPATAWDHCHDHDFVRGPLCGSCNTREGTASPEWFLREEDKVRHLLECRACRQQRTLPRRYHTGVVLAHLERTERHGRCRRPPYVEELAYEHGVHRFELSCGWHASGTWTKDISAAEKATLVHAFVEAALAAQDGNAPPGSRSSTQ
ncbi:endonuclease domain-containing protein [Streptomyces chartreusis]